jgi:hypothetical protein
MLARRLILSLLVLTLTTIAVAQQQVTFNHQTFNAVPSTARVAVDLNNDGATDVVTNSSSINSVFVLLSNGNGGFQPPVEYPIGFTVRDVTAADVDGDGNADVVLSLFDNAEGAFRGIGVMYGKGDGTLLGPVFYRSTDIIPDRAVVADFNGDGKKDVLVVGGSAGDGNYYARLFSNTGSRTFSYGGGIQISNDDSCCDFTALISGDFDGDGHADFFVQRDHQANGPNTSIDLYTAFGDGAGHFVAGPTVPFTGNLALVAADLNSDGKTDIVGILANAGDNGNITSNAIVFRGNSGRAFTETNLFVFPGGSPRIQVADFNGDGSNDIAFFGDDRVTPGLWLGLQQNGAFTIQKTANNVLPDLLGDFNHDGRPDLAQAEGNTLEVLYNDTQGGFNYCLQPAHGISGCSPADGSTITINSPNVMFLVGAADFSPIRKLEVWENGSKLIQQFYGYFDYAFMSVSRQFSTGTHTVTLLATGYDHIQMKKNVTFTVGSSSGCSTPTSGIHVCDPVDNSSVSAGSSIHAIATGMTGTARMEVLVDGVRKSSVSGSHLDVHFILGVKGTRKITFNSYNSAGTRTATKTLTMIVQ